MSSPTMLPIASKSPAEIERLAEGFASGHLFTGLHIALSADYPDKGKALRTCFLPMDAYSPEQWRQVEAAKWVPFQWVKQARKQLSAYPPLYVFPEFEFLTWADALAVLRYAQALHKLKPAAP